MTPETIAAAMEATWPAFAVRTLGPWQLRDGKGGGKAGFGGDAGSGI